ncbi:MAG: hypothetical protein H6598_07730 [Flavobacteriales bacterium]|nr:hypothetical protein [Flavobacteriales bacterium]
MNRLIYILILSQIVWFNATSQSMGNNVSYFDDKVQQVIEMDGYGSYGSNVMDVETMKLFYKGGFFEDDLKSESLKRLSGKNLIGGEYGFRIAYKQPYMGWMDSAGLYGCYEIGGAAGMSFTSDLFKLTFLGNQEYVGDSAMLSGMEVASFTYKKIGLGYIKAKEEVIHQIGVSLMGFDSYSYGMLDRGVYSSTAEMDTLNLRLSGEWMSNSRVNQNSPVGFGIGVDYEAKLLPVTRDSVSMPMLVCGVKNLGVFFSTPHMNVMVLDTIYRYTSSEVNNISDLSDDLFPQNLSQDSLLPQFEQMRKFKMLPFEVYFYSPSDPFGKKLQLTYGMRYRYSVAMIPEIYLGGDWRPGPNTIVSSNLFFGGYSYFKIGLSIRKQIGNLRVGVALNNVPGFVTKEAYQQSLAISLSYGIK